MIKKIIPLLSVSLILSCGSVPEKPDVSHTKVVKGRAVISEITPPDVNGYSGIYFDFIPDNVKETEAYLCPSCSDFKRRLRHDNTDIFHANWIREWGIKRGSAYVAERIEHRGDNGVYEVFFDVTLKP